MFEAPGGGVLHVMLNVSYDSVLISWSPLPDVLRHGAIVAYHVQVADADSRNTAVFALDSNVSSHLTRLRVEGLVPFYGYSYSIVAANSAGRGPAVTGNFRTPVTSMFCVEIVLHYFCEYPVLHLHVNVPSQPIT